jgi:hypothetical protein
METQDTIKGMKRGHYDKSRVQVSHDRVVKSVVKKCHVVRGISQSKKEKQSEMKRMFVRPSFADHADRRCRQRHWHQQARGVTIS